MGQDMLLPNLAIWHTEYFKLEEFEKWHAQEGFSDLSLKWIIKLSCEKCLPSTQRKRASLSPRHEQESEQTGLALFASLLHLFSPYHIFYDSPFFIKMSIKTLRSTTSLDLHFLKKVPMSCKTYIK